MHVSLLEQKTTKKRQVETSQIKLDKSICEEYKVETICNSETYAKELGSDQLPGFYYSVFWKGYLEEENTWEPTLAI